MNGKTKPQAAQAATNTPQDLARREELTIRFMLDAIEANYEINPAAKEAFTAAMHKILSILKPLDD